MPVVPQTVKKGIKTLPVTRSDTLICTTNVHLVFAAAAAAAVQPITLYYEADHINVLVRQWTIWLQLRHRRRVF